VSWLITAAGGHGLTRGGALGEHKQARTLCEDTLSRCGVFGADRRTGRL
jgi:hypothetical protein